MPGSRILLIDDDPAILLSLRRSLELRRYSVASGTDGDQLLALAQDFRPDVVVLDLLLPGIDGVEACRQLRRTSSVPVIVLSAVGADSKKIEALNAGADDYMTKPFNVEELDARIRVWLRRSAGRSSEGPIVCGPVTLDVQSHAVSVDASPLHLTPREFDLLCLLVENPGRILTQRTIMMKVWGEGHVDDGGLLRTFVHQLRRKLLEVSPVAAAMIVNDPGVGYRLIPPQR